MLALNRPVAPPWMRGVGALALLIGWNGALTGYDRLALRPVRELALKPPPYRTLIVYRVNPGYPSLQFYRRGAYLPVGDPATAQAQMTQTGAYCLTTDPISAARRQSASGKRRRWDARSISSRQSIRRANRSRLSPL
jgi:hypothetical protein